MYLKQGQAKTDAEFQEGGKKLLLENKLSYFSQASYKTFATEVGKAVPPCFKPAT